MLLRFLTIAILLIPIAADRNFAQTSPPASDTRIVIESEGWKLAGNFRRPEPAIARPAAVLLLHGAARDRRTYIPLAAELAARGIASLRIDLRAEGESTNLGRFEPGTTNHLLEGTERDVVAALRWLRQQSGLERGRIGVLGASYTGEAMAAAARLGATGDSYVALSPGSFSDESARAIDASGRPWWFIASRDERFAAAVVRRIPDMSRRARVTMVEGTSHASEILSPHFPLNAEIADWLAAGLANRPRPDLWGSLDAGAWPVGYRRLATGPTVVDLWYPAATDHCAGRMAFADYLRRSEDLRGATSGFPQRSGSVEASLSVAITGTETALGNDVAHRILSAPMAACLDAAPAARAFPLVLWTPRYATTSMQAVLSEYLASRGFAVAFARPAAGAPMPFELADVANRRTELAARVADMRHAVALLSKRAEVDATRIGVVAWSYTGEIGTAFDQVEPRVRLVVGLSTNVLSNWVYDPDALPTLDAASLHAAYALFRQSAAEPAPRPPLLERLPTSYFLDMPGMSHGAFNTLEGYIPALMGVTTVQNWSSSDAVAHTGYAGVAVMLTRLLRHHLTADPPQALARLPLLSGLPDGIVR